MAWYDWLAGMIPGAAVARGKGTSWTNIGEDPAGAITGRNTQGLGGISNILHDNPQAVANAYNDAMGYARQYGQQAFDFLNAQRAKALQAYGPIQHIFQNLYGSEGMKPAVVPGAPGAIQSSYGGGAKY